MKRATAAATHGCLAAADLGRGAACAATIDDATAGAAPGRGRARLARRRGGRRRRRRRQRAERFSAARPVVGFGAPGPTVVARDGGGGTSVAARPGRGWVVAVAADAFGAARTRPPAPAAAPRRLGPARWGC